MESTKLKYRLSVFENQLKEFDFFSDFFSQFFVIGEVILVGLVSWGLINVNHRTVRGRGFNLGRSSIVGAKCK